MVSAGGCLEPLPPQRDTKLSSKGQQAEPLCPKSPDSVWWAGPGSRVASALSPSSPRGSDVGVRPRCSPLPAAVRELTSGHRVTDSGCSRPGRQSRDRAGTGTSLGSRERGSVSHWGGRPDPWVGAPHQQRSGRGLSASGQLCPHRHSSLVWLPVGSPGWSSVVHGGRQDTEGRHSCPGAQQVRTKAKVRAGRPALCPPQEANSSLGLLTGLSCGPRSPREEQQRDRPESPPAGCPGPAWGWRRDEGMWRKREARDAVFSVAAVSQEAPGARPVPSS